MKKLLSLLLVLILLLFICGCEVLINQPDSNSTSLIPVSSDDISSEISSEIPSEPSSQIVSEISSEISKITEEEAIEIASKHWGIKSGDIDQKTGFRFLIMLVNSQNENIKIALKWLVNNQNYSTVDTVEIDPFTGKIVPYDTEE